VLELIDSVYTEQLSDELNGTVELHSVDSVDEVKHLVELEDDEPGHSAELEDVKLERSE